MSFSLILIMVKLKYILIFVLLLLVTGQFNAFALTDSSSLIYTQSLSGNLLEFLKIILSWPVVILVIVLIFKQQIVSSSSNILERLSSLSLGDIKLHLINTIETQEEIKGTIVNQIQEIEKQKEQINSQQKIINNLVIFSMSSFIFKHLSNIYHRKNSKQKQEYLYHDNEAMRREMYYLSDNGFIEPTNNSQPLGFDRSLDGKDLVEIVKLTPIGNFLVELRDDIKSQEKMNKI